ncbi:MAG: GAF domain-containing protein, partial [Ardenticatenaceae bacterium]
MTDSVREAMSGLSATLPKILRLAQEAIPFDKGAIHLIQGDSLRTHAVLVRSDLLADVDIQDARLSLDEGFCAHVAREGKLFLSPVVSEETRVRPARDSGSNLDMQSFLGLPLRWEGAVIGVLEMDSLTPRFFQPRHVELAEVVADQAAIAIVNARLAEDRQRLTQMSRALGASLD